MPQACWQVAADGRYYIDVALGTRSLQLMIDLGLVDPANQVGLELEPALYDQLKQLGQFSRMRFRSRRDASGRYVKLEAGLIVARLICPVTGSAVGPSAQVYALRGFPNVPSRVGTSFFHRLHGCHVSWDLDKRTWCIDYP